MKVYCIFKSQVIIKNDGSSLLVCDLLAIKKSVYETNKFIDEIIRENPDFRNKLHYEKMEID